jgi:glycosyltransferase involved in cell wall biosynthesis
MHVCFLCNEYPPASHGGVGMNTQTLARALARRGHTVSVIGHYREPHDVVTDDQGVRVIRLAHATIRRTGFVVNGFRLRKALDTLHRERPIDIIEGPEWGLAMVSKRFAPVKTIRLNGGHHFFSATLGRATRRWSSWQEHRSFACANHFCAVSRFVAEETRRLLNLGDRPIEVIPNAIDLDRFQPRPDVATVAGRVMFVGTVCEKKGVRQLIEAIPRVAVRVPSVHLWVVGRDGRDDQTGQSYTASLRSSMPPDVVRRVYFAGPVDNEMLPALLATADVCAYPSHMESQGIAIVEGMAMGKAVVANRTGPGPEIVDDGRSGLLCNPHEAASIAQSLTTVLTDDVLRRRLGREARVRTLREFSISTLVARNETFYERCLTRH